MGLDMWLVSKDKKDRKSINNAPSWKEEAYWRKFNALHGYIIDNFAGGEDDQGYIFLDRGDIKTIKEVVENSITLYSQCVKKLLETDAAFASEYEEWSKLDSEEGTLSDEEYRRYYNLSDNIAEKITPLMEENIAAGASCLKPRAGFFFGSDQFDNYYFSECVRTNEILTALLESEEFDKKQFYYTCWW